MLKPTSIFLTAFVLAIQAPQLWASDHGAAAHHDDHATAATHESAHAKPATASPHGNSHAAEHSAPAKPSKPGFFATLGWALKGAVWDPIAHKIDDMRHLDENNQILRKELAKLEAQNARLERELSFYKEGSRAARMKHESLTEGGVESARTVASLSPADAALLSHPPKIIFEKSLQAFADGDFETAARGLAFLVENEENDAFKTSKAFFTAGVSLFKLGNYKKARRFFQESAHRATGADLPYAPKSLSWISLCERKLGNAEASRKALHDLIQKYPKSKEAQRLNQHA